MLDPSLHYYAVNMTAEPDGEIWLETLFDGWGDPEARTEIRVPDFAKAEAVTRIWNACGEDFLIRKE